MAEDLRAGRDHAGPVTEFPIMLRQMRYPCGAANVPMSRTSVPRPIPSQAVQGPTGTQSVDRAMELLKLIGEARDGASLADLSAAMNLAKPTCRRLLLALVRVGMVEQTHHGNRYWLGAELFELARRAMSGYVLTDEVREEVRALAERCGETCLLSIRRGNFAVVVARFDGVSRSEHRVAPGAEFPLGVGAAPLAMIAAISKEDAEKSLLANDRLISRQYRRATLDRILAGRAEANERGFAVNRGMVFDGVWGLAVALKATSGHVVGAISISTQSEQLLSAQRQRELGEALAATAAKIGQLLPC